MHSGAYSQPEQPPHGYNQQFSHEQMAHYQQMQQQQQQQQHQQQQQQQLQQPQWAQQQQHISHQQQQQPLPKFDLTATQQIPGRQYQQHYARPLHPNTNPNIDGLSGASGSTSGSHHGHVSPTRSGSVSSSHGTTMMSPPPPSLTPQNGKSHPSRSSASYGPGKPPKAPEKPLIPYLRFSKSVWESVKKANPGMQFADIGKIIGEQWRGCPAEAKAKFSEEYAKDKERYAQAQKAYLESPEYLDYLAAKTRREQHEEEEKKRRENVGTAAVSPSRTAYSQHSGGSEPSQSSLHGPLEEMQSMSQRIIPPKLALASRDGGAEVADDETDDCLRAKHVASTRYRRNHRLLADVFSDSIVPDGRMIVNEQRMTVLQNQVSSLTHHQDRLLAEQADLVEKHEFKKQKLVADSETFAEKLAKVREEYKPVTKEQYQGMVDRYVKLLEKQWTDIQAQNLARLTQDSLQSVAEANQASTANDSGHVALSPEVQLPPAPDVTGTNLANGGAESEVDSHDTSSTTDAMPGNVPEDANNSANESVEMGDIAGVGVPEISEELTEVGKSAGFHGRESLHVDGSEESSTSQHTAVDSVVAANADQDMECESAALEEEAVEDVPTPKSVEIPRQVDHSEAISSDEDSGVIPPEDQIIRLPVPLPSVDTVTPVDESLTSPKSVEQQLLSPGSEGSVGQTLRDMVSSVASPAEVTENGSVSYAEFSL